MQAAIREPYRALHCLHMGDLGLRAGLELGIGVKVKIRASLPQLHHIGTIVAHAKSYGLLHDQSTFELAVSSR